ncbi:hypothetical protein [Zhongshania sp.]|uniref:hypothetical protein n=1 Tax=Zhongshania sp. TaxID=1971902 RepID=UPI00356932CE
MKPKTQEIAPTDDLCRSRVDQMINMHHELVMLTQRIDWHCLDSQLDLAMQMQADHPEPLNGRPAITQIDACLIG